MRKEVYFAIFTILKVGGLVGFQPIENYKRGDPKKEMTLNNDKAIFGGGCFWCMEAVFNRVEGVVEVESGYAGGETNNPTYREVCTGETGHAEVIQVIYDKNQISYGELLDVFWQAHDPTTLNRQGQDIGTQYRSIILVQGDEQKSIADSSKKMVGIKGEFKDAVVTEIELLKEFYHAEKYHQDYFRDNRSAGYCRLVISPKIKKLQKKEIIGEGEGD